MADIESLMYSYPAQGDPDFTSLLALREELWPSAYDVQRIASQEVTAHVEDVPPSAPVSRRSRRESEVEAAPVAAPDEEEAPEHPMIVDSVQMTDENVARQAVRVLCERFMLVYDRLFLYYSTGAGKTVISTGATEPLVRNMATELVDSYLEPKRTNLRRVIVIVSSDAQKRDFMKKIIETSRRSQYERAARIGANQPISERMATYAAALTPTYVFHTKTSFISFVYGTANTHGDVDPTRPDPGGLAFANNSIILIDEIHSFSREESATATKKEDAEDVDKKELRDEEDFRYAQYHYVLHAVQGSKIIGLSATPMKDSPQEIAKVMNLILPLDKQIPAGINVLSRDVLMPYLRGYVSYFRTRTTRAVNRGVMMSLTESADRTGEVGADFEVVFPVAMSPLQSKVYKRVISERDSFNRNALRASNIVYPDESAGHAGFLSRFVKSTRGWDGMEPTDEYRSFLRASRANREMLSPKFCAIADICRVSRGVVFVYMRNLEGGLYDLAAFLDAEGFERFTPQTTREETTSGSHALFIQRDDGSHEMLISRRPRYSLVIGETKTVPGRLDGILGLCNVDENADGDYLKIILGSAAVRESFDVRNSITGILASPEQTETAMIQAIGRILRPGAQRALFRKFPELPPIISIYRMASYVPSTKYEGKDVDTYLDSARKDRRIKVVERMLRDASIDCRMLHAINYDEMDDIVDDSPACLYGPCDYVCDSRPAQDDVLDSSSMNALYRGEKLIRLKMEIAKAARRQMYVPIADVDAVVDSHALAQRVIETMNVTKEQVRDRYGRQAYVYHDRNGVFFASSPVITGLVGDDSGSTCPVSMSDYEHYVTTTLVTPLDTLTGTSLLLPGVLETILVVTPTRAVTESISADRELLKKFALYLRREVVPKSSLLEHVRVRGEQRVHGIQGSIVYWVDYSGLLYTRGDLRVYEGDAGITPIVDKKTSGMPLRLVERPGTSDELPGTWGPPGPVLMRILHHRWRSYMRDLFAPYESRFTFYGVIRPSEPNILRIARRGRDNAKTPGRALPSWSGEDLKEVLATLYAGQGKVTDRHRQEADEKLSSLASSRDVNEFLKSEFERRGMLLML